MNNVGFLYELHKKNGDRILTQSVSGARLSAMLEHIAKTYADLEQVHGKGQVELRMLKARLSEDTVVVGKKRMESLTTLVMMAVEHYREKAGELVVETNFAPTPKTKLAENLQKVLGDPKKRRKLAAALTEDEQNDETMDLPSLKTGDTLLVGKFKNRRAEITGFETDDNNQPVAKTTKGDQKIFKPRIEKLMQQQTEEFKDVKVNQLRMSPTQNAPARCKCGANAEFNVQRKSTLTGNRYDDPMCKQCAAPWQKSASTE